MVLEVFEPEVKIKEIGLLKEHEINAIKFDIKESLEPRYMEIKVLKFDLKNVIM